MKHKRNPVIVTLLVVLTIFVVTFVTMFFVIILSPDDGFNFSDGIGIVEVNGTISDSKDILEQLNSLVHNKSVKAIVLRVNSPGGSVAPCQEIQKEIKRITGIMPVVASLGAVAASGGYYIVSSATSIYANPGSIVGSIGVIMEFPNFKGLLEKIGVTADVVKSGYYKDIGSPFRVMEEDEKEFLEKLVNEVRNQFVEAIIDGRKLTRDKVNAFSDGRIFTGMKAFELGLVDNIGNFNDAVNAASKSSGIDGEPRIIYSKKKRTGILGFLFGDDFISNIYNMIPVNINAPVAYLYKY